MTFTLGDYLTAINYKVNDGGDYCWNCFGKNAYGYSHNKPREYSFDIVFDTVDRFVYMVVFGTMDKTYQWVDENFADAFQEEYKIMQERLGFEDDENLENFTGRTEEFKQFINNFFNKGE
jgi:hypothetical protein